MNAIIPSDIDTRPVTVVGAGTLGRRVALMFAARGGEVRVLDASEQTAADALAYVERELGAVAASIEGGAVGRVSASSDLPTAVARSWLVVEAVPERLELKSQIFAQLDRHAADDAILATNSSSFPSSSLISGVARPQRVVNLHFFMPPQQRAAELMSCGRTDPEVLAFLTSALPLFGIRPFVARTESMGFIFNRIWAAIKREALQVVSSGVATPAEVDELWKLNTGLPFGVFQGMDHVGLDVVLDIEESYAARYPHLSPEPRALLREYVDAGRLGVKTGHGFYPYTS